MLTAELPTAPEADPVKYTQVPYDEIKAAAEAAAAAKADEPATPATPVEPENAPLRRAAEFGERFVSAEGILAEEAGAGQGAIRAKQGML